MAILHGTAAQWPKQQADRVFSRVVFLIALLAVAGGIFLGIGYVQKNILLALLAGAAVLIVVPVLIRALFRPLRELRTTRIQFWRGAHTQALVAWIIKFDLPDSWHLFNSFKLQPNWDFDHVLVGPGGIFVISATTQRGCFSLGRDGSILLNNQPTTLATDAYARAAELRSRLQGLMGPEAPFVQSILAVPFAYVDLYEKSDKTWILHQENLAATLAAEGAKPRLTKPQIKRVRQSLQALAADLHDS